MRERGERERGYPCVLCAYNYLWMLYSERERGGGSVRES